MSSNRHREAPIRRSASAVAPARGPARPPAGVTRGSGRAAASAAGPASRVARCHCNDVCRFLGDLSVEEKHTDPDSGDTHTFAVDDARFEVVGGQLKLKAGQSLDFEAETKRPQRRIGVDHQDAERLAYGSAELVRRSRPQPDQPSTRRCGESA